MALCATGRADVAESQFVQQSVIEGERVCEAENSVARVVGTRKPGNVGYGIEKIPWECNCFVTAVEKTPCCYSALLREEVVDIGQELIVVKIAGIGEQRNALTGKRPGGIDRLWRRNQKGPIGQFEIQQCQSGRVNV